MMLIVVVIVIGEYTAANREGGRDGFDNIGAMSVNQ